MVTKLTQPRVTTGKDAMVKLRAARSCEHEKNGVVTTGNDATVKHRTALQLLLHEMNTVHVRENRQCLGPQAQGLRRCQRRLC